MPKRISNLPGSIGISAGILGGIVQSTTVLVVAWALLGLAWVFARLEQPQSIKKEEQS